MTDQNPLLKHTCHAFNCDREIAPRFLMCPKHWRMVPRNLQVKVYATYRSGQEVDKQASSEYLKAAREAVEAVRDKESGILLKLITGIRILLLIVRLE